MSVFNDDKKTELIGEAWIDLRDIVVPGGGQSDHWHQLACRGKYAGELRIEITYYDSRPKPEKPASKTKHSSHAEADGKTSASNPRAVPKRRPLPSDPVTGKPPTLSSPAPEPGEPQPARPQPNPPPASFVPAQPPPQHAEYNAAPPPAPQTSYQQLDHMPRREPSTEFGTTSWRADAPPQQYRAPERSENYAVQPPDQGYNPHYQQPAYGRYEPRPHDAYSYAQASEAGSFEDDRPPPPPVHRSRAGSNSTVNGAFQSSYDLPAKGMQPTMRQDVLRSEAHRHSASGGYPGRPAYKPYDSAAAALPPQQYAGADHQPAPPRHYSYDPSYDAHHRPMHATVEDGPESPESLNNSSLRRTSGRWPQHQSQPLDYDAAASPAPLSLNGRGSNGPSRYHQTAAAPDHARHQGPNGYHMSSSDVSVRESPEYAPNFGRHSEPALGFHSAQEDHRALAYRSELDDNSNGYSVPPVPPSLIPGIDPSIAKELSDRINEERKQAANQQAWRYSQHAPAETPPRGRTMGYGYDHDGAPAAHHASRAAHSRSPVAYTNGPSTSSVNVVVKSRAHSPNPSRDPSPNPHHQHAIRRKSVSPRPPSADGRRLSGVPFGPDSYDALNPSVSSAAIKEPASSQPDYHEATGKIITHDGREVDPSDHLPMESWAPEPEAKNPKPAPSNSPSARASPSGPQPQTPSGRRPLRIAGRPQSMLSSMPAGAYSTAGRAETAVPTHSASTGRRLQKKTGYRTSTSAIVPVMSGANGPGPGPAAPGSNGVRRSSGNANGVESAPLAPLPPHADNFTPPRQRARAITFDYAPSPGNENYVPVSTYGSSPGSYGHGLSYSHSHNHGHGHNHANGHGRSAPPPLPAKVPLALPPTSAAPSGPAMSGALQLHSSSVVRRAATGLDDGYFGGPERDGYDMGGAGGGSGNGSTLSLEEELRQIDIGTGRSSRRNAAQAQAQAQGHGYGYGYGHGGY